MNVPNPGMPPGNSSSHDPGGEMFDASCPIQLAGPLAAAEAGTATAIINAMTNATVTIKSMRHIFGHLLSLGPQQGLLTPVEL